MAVKPLLALPDGFITSFTSTPHVFSTDDILGTFSGDTVADDPTILDTLLTSDVAPLTDKDGNTLYAIDSEFGFHVNDFLGADAKTQDYDYMEGWAGNIYQDIDGDGIEEITGIALTNAETDLFKSGLPLGTWSMGLGGMTVKASTEHYNVMAHLLSDQAFPNDPDAVYALDNDLKMLDRRPTGVDGALEDGALHELYVDELVTALEKAIVDNDAATTPQTYTDLDFDRDGNLDTYATKSVSIDVDTDGDGVVETIQVGGVDLGNDGSIDIVDKALNGFGTADLVDLMDPNESSITYDIAYSSDYSVTVKDDGKLLYRWGTAVKRPNDIRMDVKLDLPEEWTRDADENGIADSIEGGGKGYKVTRAELIITHDITNNPNDQVRPEDYENEGATGRKPSYYVIVDPDDATNTLWVSPVDSFDGEGTALPSYFKLTESGQVDLTAGGTAVYDPEGTLVGYRNEDESGAFIGTVLRDLSMVAVNEAAGLDFSTSDLAGGFTNEYYTSINRDPFEWSYDKYAGDPYKQVFEGFESRDAAEAAGYTDDALVSGPRWRLLANKFGQDLPGLEIPLIDNSEPPYQKDNIKYNTGDSATTVLNLLDWGADADGDGIVDDSPLLYSSGWMVVDPDRLDVNADGIIDEGWSQVNGLLGAGDALPSSPILTAVTPNGQTLRPDFLDTAVYLKGDRSDSAKIYDIQLKVEYETDNGTIGAVQQVTGLTEADKAVTFEGGASFSNPVVFASPVSLEGGHPVTVEFSDITSTGATLHLEEPEYLDGAHKPESVTLLTLEEGVWSLADGSLLQVGTTTFAAGATDAFHTVNFDVAFDEAPVLMLQVQSDNGRQWEIVRADNVTTTGFQYAIQEEEALTGGHTSEVVGWAALDAAAANGVIDWNGIGVQAFNTGATVTHEPSAFQFEADVGTDPLVAAILASYNGPDPANLRLSGIYDDGVNATAEFVVAEEKSLDSEIRHLAEDVSGLAFETSGLLTGTIHDAFVFA